LKLPVSAANNYLKLLDYGMATQAFKRLCARPWLNVRVTDWIASATHAS
jgi:hypothetical protein